MTRPRGLALVALTVLVTAAACSRHTTPAPDDPDPMITTPIPGHRLVVDSTYYSGQRGGPGRHYVVCLDPADDRVWVEVPITAAQDYGDASGRGALSQGDPCPTPGAGRDLP